MSPRRALAWLTQRIRAELFDMNALNADVVGP
jgi:hypothetical protein